MTVDFHSLTDHFERVYSKRLALRQVALSDAWPLFQATRNPLFNRHLLWDQPDDDARVLERIDSIVEAVRKGRLTALSAVLKSTGEWVSLYRFQPHAVYPEHLEMGIWCHDRFWHGRYSLELVRTCIDAVFTMFDVPVLVGAAAPENRSSCKLMELSGMLPTKLVYRANEANAKVELQEFEITREAWSSTLKEPAHRVVPLRAPALQVNATTLAGMADLRREKQESDRARRPRMPAEISREPWMHAAATDVVANRLATSEVDVFTSSGRAVRVSDPDQSVLER